MTNQFIEFKQLAKAYFPRCKTSKNAVRCLSREISKCAALSEQLIETGWQPYNHRLLSPKQFYLIVSHFGNPFENS